jgi:hypothetical protein
VVRDPAGATFFYRSYCLHRDGDLPAVIWDRGHSSWYRDSDLHRDGDQPATVYANGRREWAQEGSLHRDGGPAVIDPGTLGFPLDECAEISPRRPYERWCHKDFSRRMGGPLKHANGEHRVGGPSSYATDGSWERWCQRGFLHRTDGPALRLPEGTVSWYWQGLLHRADGPAVTRPDGKVEFYRHGLRHRVDGPAVISAKGARQFWLNGIKVPAPRRGELPQPQPPLDRCLVTYAGRRFRLGVRLTSRPLRQSGALDLARERRDLTGAVCVLRSITGLLGETARLEKAYDTMTGGGIVYGDGHRFHVYEAELLDDGRTYPQPTEDPDGLPPMPTQRIKLRLSGQ